MYVHGFFRETSQFFSHSFLIFVSALSLIAFGCDESRAHVEVLVDSGTGMDVWVAEDSGFEDAATFEDGSFDGGEEILDDGALDPEPVCAEPVELSTSLQDLKTASCEMYCILVQDKDNHACMDDGACRRLPEKFRKMCTFRFDDVKQACDAEEETKARQSLIAAYDALRDHLGLRAHYCQTDQTTCEFAFERLGMGLLESTFATSFNYTPQQMKSDSLTDARERLLSIAASVPAQDHLKPVALSVAAEVSRRLNASSVCD